MNVTGVRVNVNEGYNVFIGKGILESCGELIKNAGFSGRCAVITDTNVEKLYLARVMDSLIKEGFFPVSYAFPAGEKNKNMETLSVILEFLAEKKLTRSDFVIALGGGVTGDMAGFAAGTYMRGIKFVQIPTTFLAAVDSSVGGKTAVNLSSGKNLAGLFHQPSLVIMDTDTLSTLSEEDYACGCAESIKTGIIGDRALFEMFENETVRGYEREIIARAVTVKARIVEADEKETGERKLLNLGHTYGHAVERLSNFEISHGYAVSIGLAMAARAAERMGDTEYAFAERILETLKKNGLPVKAPYSAEALFEASATDKKMSGKSLSVIIPKDVENCEIRKIRAEEFLNYITEGMKGLKMTEKITPSPLKGKIKAIASKSEAHRHLILCALAEESSVLEIHGSSNDINATVDCIRALGAKVEIDGDLYKITPGKIPEKCVMNVRESGTTFRLMLPVAAALCENVRFEGEGRLPERPIKHLMDALRQNGVSFSNDRLPFETHGRMKSGVFTVPGDVSSQYISGLMMALPFLDGDSEIRIEGELKSKAYVDLTFRACSEHGVRVFPEEYGYLIPGHGGFFRPSAFKKNKIVGDWSNAAFFLAAAAIGGEEIIVTDLWGANQGDRRVMEFLERFGAEVNEDPFGVRVKGGNLTAINIDIDETPDLIAPLGIVAAYAKGTTVFYNAARLRLKESDRIESMKNMINALGGHAEAESDKLIVHGNGSLPGGTCVSENDHRIAMAAAIAGAYSENGCTILGAEAVNKSYPGFFDDFAALGGKADVL